MWVLLLADAADGNLGLPLTGTALGAMALLGLGIRYQTKRVEKMEARNDDLSEKLFQAIPMLSEATKLLAKMSEQKDG